MPAVESAQDKKWNAEQDARTLSEANVILDDAKRLSAAQKAAKTLAKDAADNFKGMMKVAGQDTDTVEGMKVIN